MSIPSVIAISLIVVKESVLYKDDQLILTSRDVTKNLSDKEKYVF